MWLVTRSAAIVRPFTRSLTTAHPLLLVFLSPMSASVTSSVSASQQTSSGATSAVSIPASAPAGLLTITQPPQTSIAFFKIAPSQPVTFAWNFSYVLSTPAHLTVSAICQNGNTYPIGPTDGIIPGSATSVVWDPYAWDQNNPNSPLPQATYTLEIFDNRGPGSARAPGLLQPNNALRFALYTPQSYTPIGSGKLLRFSLVII
jgi:hypothetical protein